MIRNTDGTERLYLSKGVKEDQSIYIENCKIPQHHIDGIRFLYRQYKKKKSGVIITDTSGYGRNLQIVLFLKAVRHLFDKPVLVLCHEGTEHDWVEQFQTWTDLCDDVVLETEKPSIKKLVLINTMSKLEAFSGREWSVLVMDGDRCSQQVLRLPFKADYKIWVTPVNMRENLEKFSQIYKWLYPKEKFDKSQFTPDNSDPLDVVDKAVLLDAFMEDIVAKSDHQDTSRDTENNKKDELPAPMKISRKNKDATGTKIKRSKRKIYDDEDDAPLSKAKKDTTDGPAPSNESKSTTVSNEDYENAMSTKYDTTDDFRIANFKRKSIEEFDEDLLGEKEESNTATSQVDLYYEPDTATENNSDRLYEMDTLVFDNNTCNEQSSNDDNNKDTERDRESKENYSDDDKTQSENDFVTENNTPIKMSNNYKKDEQNLNEINNGNEDIDNNRGSPSIFEMKIENSDDDEESKLNIDEMESDINDIKSDICELEASKELNSVRNAIKSRDNEINNTRDTALSNELTADNDKNVILNEVQNKLNENEAINKSNSVTNDVVAPVTKSMKKNCIEDKMREMEEKAMKKFKGSILDNLF